MLSTIIITALVSSALSLLAASWFYERELAKHTKTEPSLEEWFDLTVVRDRPQPGLAIPISAWSTARQGEVPAQRQP